MKRFLLVLAIVGVLFSACESGGGYGNENDDNSTENTGGGDDTTLSDELTISQLKADNPLIYANGGSATITVESERAWQAVVVEPTECNWLTLESNKSRLTLTTNRNESASNRSAVVEVQNGATTKQFVVEQRANIIKRTKIGERDIFVQLAIGYNFNRFSKLVVVLPVPQTNLYQDIDNLTVSGGKIMTAANNKTQYVRRTLTPSEIPTSGGSVLREEFRVTNYGIEVDFDAITSYVDIDTASEVYKKYVGRDGDIIVPGLPQLQPLTEPLWAASKGDVVDYARLCYEYVAANMKYINPNTGLHSLATILANGGGDCGNQATLYISMLRNKGIPARHVVMIRPDGTFHVRAEFYLAGYGWIPVDANAKNMNPNGDYFGKIETNEIVVNNDINIKMLGSNDSVEENIVLLQDFLWWYWITGSMSCEIYRTTGVF